MKSHSNDISRARPLLGTFVEIGIGAGEPVDAIDAAFDEIAAIHRLMSFHESTSDVSRLNRSPVGEDIGVDKRTYEVLAAALAFSGESGGLFDVTIGGQLVAAGLLPKPEGAGLCDRKACHRDIVMLRDNRVLRRRAAIVDLGGIAKGYAVDRAVDLLQEMGVRNAIVNAGGDMRIFGAPRPVHVRLPDNASEAYFVGVFADVAVASSSGVYAWSKGEGPLEALVDPQRRVLRRWKRGITVFAPNCMAADALTKVVGLAPGRASDVLRRHGGRALAIDRRGIGFLRDRAALPVSMRRFQ